MKPTHSYKRASQPRLCRSSTNSYGGMKDAVEQNPDRADFLRELSVSYNKMGDLMLSLGQGEQARLYFQKDLDIADRLAAQEPDRADFLRDLSVSYNKMGDLMRSLGQGEQALLHFKRSLDIAERLAAQEPDRADFLRDLSVSYEQDGRTDAIPRPG